MSDERDYWSSLERRISDLDIRFSNLQRDYQRDYDKLNQFNLKIDERVNQGLSISVQTLIREAADNKLGISNLTNLIASTVNDMKLIVSDTAALTNKMHTNLIEKNELRLKPVETDIERIKNTFIYGLVGMAIVFGGQKLINNAWDKFFPKDAVIVAVQPEPLPKKKP